MIQAREDDVNVALWMVFNKLPQQSTAVLARRERTVQLHFDGCTENRM
jgi:hypothetical protein